jgi:hypothetical protein
MHNSGAVCRLRETKELACGSMSSAVVCVVDVSACILQCLGAVRARVLVQFFSYRTSEHLFSRAEVVGGDGNSAVCGT